RAKRESKSIHEDVGINGAHGAPVHAAGFLASVHPAFSHAGRGEGKVPGEYPPSYIELIVLPRSSRPLRSTPGSIPDQSAISASLRWEPRSAPAPSLWNEPMSCPHITTVMDRISSGSAETLPWLAPLSTGAPLRRN